MKVVILALREVHIMTECKQMKLRKLWSHTLIKFNARELQIDLNIWNK